MVYNLICGMILLLALQYQVGLGETVKLASDLYNLLVYATPKAWDEATQQMNR